MYKLFYFVGGTMTKINILKDKVRIEEDIEASLKEAERLEKTDLENPDAN